MKLKKMLLATSAVLLVLQPPLTQAAETQTQMPFIISQADNSAVILNKRLAELEAAQAAVAVAVANNENVEAAQARLDAAILAADEAQSLVKKELPDEAAVEEETPKEEIAPAAEPEPVEEKTPVVETAPVAEPDPVEEKAPTAETTPAVEQAPVEEKALAEEQQIEIKEEPIQAQSIEKQLESASEQSIVILPENVTVADQTALDKAEAERRKDAKKRRNELLGAAAVGVAVGVLAPLLGGRLIEDQGDRIIIERNGDYFVRRDENALLRGTDVLMSYEELDNGLTQEVATRPNGVKIITVRAPNGDILSRERLFPNGDRTILIDNFDYVDTRYIDYDRELPPLAIIDLEPGDYILSVRDAGSQRIGETFLAPPVEVVNEGYSLQNIRQSKRLRDTLRRLDLDTVTFDSGSATVRQSQVKQLQNLATAIANVINEAPSAIFLIEGHTDSVGSEISNLALSDRRAESIARILIDSYGLPPENFLVEGYGEAYLKINIQGDEQQNRRVAIRNIAPLLKPSKAQ